MADWTSSETGIIPPFGATLDRAPRSPSHGSMMDASKRMMLAKAMKEARAAKAGASSAPAADPVPPPTLSPPPPITAEAPPSSSRSSPHSPEALQTPSSPLPITAVPLAAVSSPAPTPLDKGKRVLEILSDDEDSESVAPFKRRNLRGFLFC
ncbi:classical arabinogalactan protein 9-like [Phaseolus vulgaris]|uniref:classical arabinogalactan protein 9-like n=1 Tax=Phaseolus vulgaris TaxID=3885 RepID=UPI0035CA67A3